MRQLERIHRIAPRMDMPPTTTSLNALTTTSGRIGFPRSFIS